MKSVVPLVLSALLLATFSLSAQNKLTPPGERKIRPRGLRSQIAEHRAQSFDAGDFYSTPEGKRTLHRLAGAVVVQIETPSDKSATVKSLARSGGVLDGYSVDFEAVDDFTVLKADSGQRQLHLSQPNALQATIAKARQAAVLRSANPLFIDPRNGHWLIPTTNIILCLQTNVDPKAYFGT